MKLLFKFNVLLIAIALVSLGVIAYVAHNFLIQNARGQVLEQAKLMMESFCRRSCPPTLRPLRLPNCGPAFPSTPIANLR